MRKGKQEKIQFRSLCRGHDPRNKNGAGNGFHANGSTSFGLICEILVRGMPGWLLTGRLARFGCTRGVLATQLGPGDGPMHPSPWGIYIYILENLYLYTAMSLGPQPQ
jgi:hypothetical protein